MSTAAPVQRRTTGPEDGPSTTGQRKPVTYERRYTGRGPKGTLLGGTMREYGADLTGSMRRWRASMVTSSRSGSDRSGHVAFGPAEIDELLTDRADLRKSFGTRMLIPLLGNGLLTAEGASGCAIDDWPRVPSTATGSPRTAERCRYAEDAAEGWRDDGRIDLHDEMTALTLRIVARPCSTRT